MSENTMKLFAVLPGSIKDMCVYKDILIVATSNDRLYSVSAKGQVRRIKIIRAAKR